VWTISHDDDVVVASAPRLAVSAGLKLRYRAVTDTAPVYIHGVIETAEFQSTARAAITIRITDVSREAVGRRSSRLTLTARATLRATICDRIVPEEVLPVTLVDLSQTGCAVTTMIAGYGFATGCGCTHASLKARSQPKSGSLASQKHPTPSPSAASSSTPAQTPQSSHKSGHACKDATGPPRGPTLRTRRRNETSPPHSLDSDHRRNDRHIKALEATIGAGIPAAT
jgi:hypothetical protein